MLTSPTDRVCICQRVRPRDSRGRFRFRSRFGGRLAPAGPAGQNAGMRFPTTDPRLLAACFGTLTSLFLGALVADVARRGPSPWVWLEGLLTAGFTLPFG